MAQSGGPWIYVNSFQSGALQVVDLAAGKVVRTIVVADGSGVIGLALTSDGKTLFVADGDIHSHLRVIDAASGSERYQKDFPDRLLVLSGAPLIDLTPDDRWLFIRTYDYAAAASGVRIFDVGKRDFTPHGLRARACPSPDLVSAQNVLVAVCPKLLQQFRNNDGEFLPGATVPSPIAENDGVALTPDGRNLFVLEHPAAGRPWRLLHWVRGERETTEHDLRALTGMEPDEAEVRRCWLDLSPDGEKLGLVCGPEMWILDRESLKIAQKAAARSPLAQAAFTPDGRELLSVRAQPDAVEVVRLGAADGKLGATPISGLKLPAGPTVLKVGAAVR